MTGTLNRRSFASGLASAGTLAAGTLALGGCMGGRTAGIDMTTTSSVGAGIRPQIGVDPGISSSAQMYGEITDGGFVLPAIPYEEMYFQYRRQRVPNHLGIPAGSALIDTRNRFAYYAFAADEAVRYGVGVGKAGFEWSGEAVVGHKKTWPVWTPPPEMIERKPELARYASGMAPGPMNPLGARSLYLFSGGKDTLYRLHGTPEWDSIGKAMSSGCIRFLNHDIIDLYERMPVGTPVRVV